MSAAARARPVAVVLHAHLPYLLEDAGELERGWLYEAIWECYLPLLGMLDRLARRGWRGSLSMSWSVPLLGMLADARLPGWLDDHLGTLERLLGRHGLGPTFRPAAAHYATRLRQAREAWDRVDGALIPALLAHADTGRLELLTTTASHAYLPGLRTAAGAMHAQVLLGRRGFEAWTGRAPAGLWLSECAHDGELGRTLTACGYDLTLTDAHGLAFAHPRPPSADAIVDEHGTAWLARDREASHRVWSRERGYPGHPAYREFHRDLAGALPPGEWPPFRMTGLKLHRITGASVPLADKAPYAPAAAERTATAHAEDFVDSLARGTGLCVAAYDAELFGHWWHEGPAFLEHTLLGIARHPGLEGTSLRGHLAGRGKLPCATPAASSWGEGGFGRVWVGERSAHLWRHVHHAHRSVEAAVRHARAASGLRGDALDVAITELLHLEASDWAFMLHGGASAAYAERRVRLHAGRVERALRIATGAEEDRSWLDRQRRRQHPWSAIGPGVLRGALAACATEWQHH